MGLWLIVEFKVYSTKALRDAVHESLVFFAFRRTSYCFGARKILEHTAWRLDGNFLFALAVEMCRVRSVRSIQWRDS